MLNKICTKCGQLKSLDNFSLTPSGNPRGSCKACRVDANRHSVPEVKDRHLQRNYGISLDTYLEMLEEQDAKCLICSSHATDEHHGVLSTDHNHDTGEVRGLLCNSCNRGLGLLKDSPYVLTKALQYLREKGDYSV